MTNAKNKLSELKNIGPTIEKRLNEVGIRSTNDLKRVGPAGAYRRIRQKYPDKTIPVCYYLYSFQGALEGKHGDNISEKTKQSLCQRQKQISPSFNPIGFFKISVKSLLPTIISPYRTCLVRTEQ